MKRMKPSLPKENQNLAHALSVSMMMPSIWLKTTLPAKHTSPHVSNLYEKVPVKKGSLHDVGTSTCTFVQ
jgi:hypothetical protein